MSKESISQEHMEGVKRTYATSLLYLREQKNWNILVTGADNQGSIGQAIVRALQPYYVHAPNQDEMDVRSAIQVKEYLRGRVLDTLVCSHGITKMDWFENMPPEDIQDVIDVNLSGSAIVAREFVRRTLTSPWRKRIVFIGSMAYNHVLNASAAYCASKAGLAMLTRCLAWELAPKGYDVICIHPSNTEGTLMSEETIQNIMRYRGISRKDAAQYWAAILPRGRWLRPEDIARVVVSFLNDPSGYLSGANIELGGGQR